MFSDDSKRWRVWMLLFFAFTTYVMLNQSAELGQITSKSNGFLRSVQMQFISEDEVRVALVMPCSFGEIITSLPIALQSIMESNKPYDETLLVFGIRHDLEHALNEVFPDSLAEETHHARNMLRNFILTWAKDIPEHYHVLKDSIEINELTSEDSMRPLEYLEAFDAKGYIDANYKPGTEDKNMNNRFNYITNLYKMFETYPTMNEIASKIPHFSIILNRDDYPYAAVNRQKGAFTAFGSPTNPRTNDIISFIDCDDLVSPVRRDVIEQVFRENKEIVEFVAGCTSMNIATGWEGVRPNQKKEQEEYPEFFNPASDEDDTPEFREAIYDKCFDFRNPERKQQYFDHQADEKMLIDLEGKKYHDAWDITNHLAGDKVNFTWWLGLHAGDADIDKKHGFMLHNGHTSWRQDWLKNKIVHFPNSKKGQDSRLTYMSIDLGGKFLGSKCPLTTYVQPNGDFKRGTVKAITEWHEKVKANANTTKSPETTPAQTTKAPTTKAPTTNAPTTKEPTTNAPTTKEPTTNAPTVAVSTVLQTTGVNPTLIGQLPSSSVSASPP